MIEDTYFRRLLDANKPESWTESWREKLLVLTLLGAPSWAPEKTGRHTISEIPPMH